MYKFEYLRPGSVDEARQMLESNEEAIVLAGGMTMLPAMKQRVAAPPALVDLTAIDSLRGITVDGNGLSIAAMTCHADVAASDIVRSAIPALAELAEGIGDAQVRNRGTIGGSISNNDPAADYPAALLGLNATIKTDRREIAADDFITGLFETALEPNEIVLSVSFPKPKRAAYMKFPNPASRYAVVGVMVAETENRVRVAVTGAGACAFRAGAYEDALNANFAAASLDGLSVAVDGLNTDMHASAEYRAHLVNVMARRAVIAAGG